MHPIATESRAERVHSAMSNPIIQLQYLELAEEFYKAFRDLPRAGPSGLPVNWPRYFALCHATELALKSYLLAHGWTERQIKGKEYRHTISKLMAEAVSIGLAVSVKARADIELLSEAHEKYWPRYPMQTSDPVFTIDQFEKPFIELLTTVTLSLRGGSRAWVAY